MRATTNISLWLVRITGTLQLALGALFWTGHAYSYVPLHIINGVVFVLTLWTIGVLALVARTHRKLAVFALFWGFALAAFGMTQATVLIGPMHWIVRVIHFLMGFAAMALGGMLGQAILAAVPARVSGSEDERAGSDRVRGVATASLPPSRVALSSYAAAKGELIALNLARAVADCIMRCIDFDVRRHQGGIFVVRSHVCVSGWRHLGGESDDFPG